MSFPNHLKILNYAYCYIKLINYYEIVFFPFNIKSNVEFLVFFFGGHGKIKIYLPNVRRPRSIFPCVPIPISSCCYYFYNSKYF